MFGYISIDKPELKIRDYNTYRGFYCGLCRSLGKCYRCHSRLLLSNDCAFFFLLSDALAEDPCEFYKGRCSLHPTEKRFFADPCSKQAQAAAALNLLLTAHKFRDDVRDEKRFSSRVLGGIYSSQYKKAAAQYPEFEQAITASTLALVKLEQKRCDNIDEVSDAFASMLGDIFIQAGCADDAYVLRSLGYSLGRYIYIIDAADDIEKDTKTGSYNPLISKFGSDKKSALECARFNLNASAKHAGDVFSLLNIKRHCAILENMLYSALYKKTKAVLDGGSNGSI